MIHLREDSPFRPVDWRWQKAVRLHRDGRPVSRVRDDEFVAKAVRFLREKAACADEWALLDLSARWPSLFDAHEVYQAAEGGPRATRWEVEARLLAGASPERVGARVGLSPDAVRWYEALFFHVTDRLSTPGWVAHHAIGPSVHEGLLNERDYGLLWKWYGYGGGEHLLDAVTALWVAPVRADGPDGVRTFCGAQQRAQLDKKALLAMLTLRTTDAFQKMQLGELHAKYLELEKTAGGGGGGAEAFVAGLEAALRALPWGVGRGGNAARHVPALGAAGDADAHAAEPRAGELLAGRAGVPVPALAAAAQLSFPVPAPKEG